MVPVRARARQCVVCVSCVSVVVCARVVSVSGRADVYLWGRAGVSVLCAIGVVRTVLFVWLISLRCFRALQPRSFVLAG